MYTEAKNAELFWDKKHLRYERKDIKSDDWLEKFELVVKACTTPVLDLGCGSGNNTLYLIEKGKQVIACDQSKNAIYNIEKNFPEIYETRCFNMLDGFDFENGTFDLIIADLCLHYFKEKDTKKILTEIKSMLSDKGRFILRVNSMNDINYGAGEGLEVEHHLYRTEDGMLKRFFDIEDIQHFFEDFEIEYCKEEKMNRYEKEKVVFCLAVKSKCGGLENQR